MRVLRLSLHLDWRAVEPSAGPAAARQVGGQAAQVVRLVRGLDARGVRQLVVSAPLPGGPRRSAIGGATVRVAGRHVEGTHRQAGAWAAAVLARLPALARDADLVHVHADGLAEAVAVAAAAPALARTPVVLTLHCSAQATYSPVSRKDAAVQVLTRAAERRALGAVDRTLVLTERTRTALGDQGRVAVVPDAVDGARIGALAADGAACRTALRERHGVASRGRLVLFVGRLDPNKGVAGLPALADALDGDDAAVLACGDGPLGEELHAAAAQRPGRLAVTGGLAHDEVFALLGAADVLVLPTRHEELGSVLLEAQAAGLPCVVHRVGGTPEAVDEGTTGLLVEPGDPDALAAAVRRALDDGDFRRRAADAGPRRVRERFDGAAVTDRVLEIYADVLASRGPVRTG